MRALCSSSRTNIPLSCFTNPPSAKFGGRRLMVLRIDSLHASHVATPGESLPRFIGVSAHTPKTKSPPSGYVPAALGIQPARRRAAVVKIQMRYVVYLFSIHKTKYGLGASDSQSIVFASTQPSSCASCHFIPQLLCSLNTSRQREPSAAHCCLYPTTATE